MSKNFLGVVNCSCDKNIRYKNTSLKTYNANPKSGFVKNLRHGCYVLRGEKVVSSKNMYTIYLLRKNIFLFFVPFWSYFPPKMAIFCFGGQSDKYTPLLTLFLGKKIKSGKIWMEKFRLILQNKNCLNYV